MNSNAESPTYAVTVGASTGGIHALMQLASALPPRFEAPVLVVQHVGALPSVLPELLTRSGPNPARHASEGERPEPGHIYVAPPDHHMLLEPRQIRLTRGPKENHSRPAIDPLFRSAAFHWRERAIGVVLTGNLDDGAAGLAAIKACGGRSLVQDPATALHRSMPDAALACVKVDFCGNIEAIAQELVRIVTAKHAGQGVETEALPEHLAREVHINRGEATMANVNAIGSPSGLSCPDCGGSLWEIKDQTLLRYRCHTGHAYSGLSLAHCQEETAEGSLRASIRALREREILLRRLAQVSRSQGDLTQAQAGESQADLLLEQAERLRRLLEGEPDAANAHNRPLRETRTG
ncbi:chemotaxis protein CheB [Hydrogenophaga sp.]|uniref:chemotaxis protein CheB n=1 Tax=Hydrogenophaga sp. TaxID=1904254 RepID=UPI003F6F45A6